LQTKGYSKHIISRHLSKLYCKAATVTQRR